MPFYIAKHRTGNFSNTPEGFQNIAALENRFWLLSSSTTPDSDLVILMPDEQRENHWYYLFPNDKKLLGDHFEGRVEFTAEVDAKGRRRVMYSPTQLDQRLSIIKWVAINAFIPDMVRLGKIDSATSVSHISNMNAFTNCEDARQYVVDHLFYDL